MSLASYIQEDPEYGHESSEHKYNPDDHGVCLDCGWWDKMGDSCPACGEIWEDHPSLEELLLELAEMLTFDILELKKSHQDSIFMKDTNFSSN